MCPTNKEYYKEYYKKNKDKFSADSKTYYQKNKEKIKASSLEYYQKNKDKINISRKEYYRKNKEKIKSASNDFYLNNKEHCAIVNKKRRLRKAEELRKYFKERYEKNKEYFALKGKIYYQKNKERKDRQSLEWRKNHLHKVREWARSYRKTPHGKLLAYNSKKIRRSVKGSVIEIYSSAEWSNMKKNSNGYCYMCKKQVGINNITLDHILPISYASKAYHNRVLKGDFEALPFIYTIEHIRPICRSCNSKQMRRLDAHVKKRSLGEVFKYLKKAIGVT